jgi:proteasome lid subunit RPN8/RPN11
MELRIPRRIYEQMISHLQAVYPLEGCGLLAGENGEATAIYPVENILQSATEYEMDPRQQLEAMLAMEAEGKQLLAIYHSHPSGPQRPSQTDIERSLYPETAYIIVSFAERQRPVSRAFLLQEGHAGEIVMAIM